MWWFAVRINMMFLPSIGLVKPQVWAHIHHSFIISCLGEWLALLLRGWARWRFLERTQSGLRAQKRLMNWWDIYSIPQPFSSRVSAVPANCVSTEEEKEQPGLLLGLVVWGVSTLVWAWRAPSAPRWLKPETVDCSLCVTVTALHSTLKA